jgi:glutaredoxin
MNKTILAILVGIFLISGALYLTRPAGEKNEEEVVVNEENVDEIDEENSEILPIEEESGEENNIEKNSLIDCLKAEGVVIYGIKTCGYCVRVVEEFGGYNVISPIYVDCHENSEKCIKEQKTNPRLVPEIQIKGELYKGDRSSEAIANEAGCSI